MTATSGRDRLPSIDFVRGLVMIVMALDHVRDFFYVTDHATTDLGQASTGLFLTRWVTHFCAPVFVFLAGTSAFLWHGRPGRSGADLSRFLLTRGAWLIVLELTVIRFAWTFNLDYAHTSGMVIWAIGWSMIALAALARLPTAWCAGVGIGTIALHNLTDGIAASAFGPLDWLWSILHEQTSVQIADGVTFWASYPLVPWIGVMAAGYAFGTVLGFEPGRRRTWLLRLGVGLTAGFIALRALNGYGDPARWSDAEGRAALSFLNTTKYPPSLAFLTMTLGPALLVLWAMDARAAPRAVVVFGRVPMFYYISHLFAIHLLALAVELAWFGGAASTTGAPPPHGWGVSLPWLYAIWAAVVAALYPLCRWYAAVKHRSDSRWLAYL